MLVPRVRDLTPIANSLFNKTDDDIPRFDRYAVTPRFERDAFVPIELRLREPKSGNGGELLTKLSLLSPASEKRFSGPSNRGRRLLTGSSASFPYFPFPLSQSSSPIRLCFRCYLFAVLSPYS